MSLFHTYVYSFFTPEHYFLTCFYSHKMLSSGLLVTLRWFLTDIPLRMFSSEALLHKSILQLIFHLILGVLGAASVCWAGRGASSLAQHLATTVTTWLQKEKPASGFPLRPPGFWGHWHGFLRGKQDSGKKICLKSRHSYFLCLRIKRGDCFVEKILYEIMWLLI